MDMVECGSSCSGRPWLRYMSLDLVEPLVGQTLLREEGGRRGLPDDEIRDHDRTRTPRRSRRRRTNASSRSALGIGAVRGVHQERVCPTFRRGPRGNAMTDAMYRARPEPVRPRRGRIAHRLVEDADLEGIERRRPVAPCGPRSRDAEPEPAPDSASSASDMVRSSTSRACGRGAHRARWRRTRSHGTSHGRCRCCHGDEGPRASACCGSGALMRAKRMRRTRPSGHPCPSSVGDHAPSGVAPTAA